MVVMDDGDDVLVDYDDDNDVDTEETESWRVSPTHVWLSAERLLPSPTNNTRLHFTVH